MPRLIDVSPLVSERLAVFPGDVPYRRAASLAIADGAHLDLSSARATLHLGAHADAPSHTVGGAASVDRLDLDAFYGPCQVMRVRVAPGARVRPEDLPDEVRAPRLLLETGSFPDPDAWNDDFASLSPALVAHLAACRVVLVGIDTPSVDPATDRELPAHKALVAAGIVNLEGLVLSHVAPGAYTLIALPLRLLGADAAPVRAALASP